jgi:hypothetical protein
MKARRKKKKHQTNTTNNNIKHNQPKTKTYIALEGLQRSMRYFMRSNFDRKHLDRKIM